MGWKLKSMDGLTLCAKERERELNLDDQICPQGMNKGDFQIPTEFNNDSNIESVMVTHEIDEEHNDNDSIVDVE